MSAIPRQNSSLIWIAQFWKFREESGVEKEAIDTFNNIFWGFWKPMSAIPGQISSLIWIAQFWKFREESGVEKEAIDIFNNIF